MKGYFPFSPESYLLVCKLKMEPTVKRRGFACCFLWSLIREKLSLNCNRTESEKEFLDLRKGK